MCLYGAVYYTAYGYEIRGIGAGLLIHDNCVVQDVYGAAS